MRTTPSVLEEFVEDSPFKVYSQFNDEGLAHFARMKHRIHSLPEGIFPSEQLPDRLARSLAAHRVIHIKELLEAFEFFVRVRKRLRRETMVDLCAGHGLVGLIFALCERSVAHVQLLDERKPSSFQRILAAFIDIAPWVEKKVSYRLASLKDEPDIPRDAGLLLVHGCGALTDRGISLALRSGGPIALMPCCYGTAFAPRLPNLSRVLGRERNIDISRSFQLESAGYQVDWTSIPSQVTPVNRVIVAWNERKDAEALPVSPASSILES